MSHKHLSPEICFHAMKVTLMIQTKLSKTKLSRLVLLLSKRIDNATLLRLLSSLFYTTESVNEYHTHSFPYRY